MPGRKGSQIFIKMGGGLLRLGQRPVDCLGGLFAHYVAGVLVVAEALEARVAELGVVGPFAETDLAYQPGLDPVHSPSGWQGSPAERRVAALEAGQAVVEAEQELGVESGADLARVHEVAFTVVIAEQERAESDPGTLRVGVAADHEFLRVLALELQPVPAASAL